MLELRGKVVADAHKNRIKERIEAWGITPSEITMGIFLVGDDEASCMYASFMEKQAKQMGFSVRLIRLPKDATQVEVEEALELLNRDASVHGILPLMPLPKGLEGERLIALLHPDKDLDGLTAINIGLATSGRGGYIPCTPKACLAILDYYKIPLAKKRAVVIGRSNVVGKPLSNLLLARDATVTICHSKTENLSSIVQEADIVIAAVGRAQMITRDMIKQGAVVIDVGINSLNGNTVGDVDYNNLLEVASAMTPVPGGVGSVTTTMMLEALFEAYCKQKGIQR